MTMANLVPTPDGRFFDPVSGQIFLDQAGMQPDMSGQPLGNLPQGPLQPGQVRSDIPTGPIAPTETPWSPAATNQFQTTDFTPAEISFMSPEAIARARSETPGMRAFDYYNMMQSAPGVRALGSTGRQIAQQRLPELQTRFGLGQYFGDMPGQGQDTFRGFMEAQPTAWGGQDWQNAMGGIRKGGMVSQAIEGYDKMTPEQQFEQRTKFLAGMSGNEKGNLMNLNEEGGREQVIAMIKGMLGGSDLPAGMRGWMDTAIEEEIAKLERDQPDLTTNSSNLLLHMSMNGFDLNGLGQPPEQKAISPYTDTKSVQAETNKATASDKAAANVTLENAATPTVENKPAITAAIPTATDKVVQPKPTTTTPQPPPEIARDLEGTEGLTGRPFTPTTPTTPTPDTGLLPGLGGEGIPTGAPTPTQPFTPTTPTPDTGLLPGLGGEDIPSFTPSAVAQPQPTTPGTMAGPSALPGGGFGEAGIPSVQQMPGRGIPLVDARGAVQPLPGTVGSGSPLLDPMGISGLTGLPPAGTMAGPTGAGQGALPNIGAPGIDPLGTGVGGLGSQGTPYFSPTGDPNRVYVPDAGRFMNLDDANRFVLHQYQQDRLYTPPDPSLTAGPAALPGGGFGEGNIPVPPSNFGQMGQDNVSGFASTGRGAFTDITGAPVTTYVTPEGGDPTADKEYVRNPFSGAWVWRDKGTRTVPAERPNINDLLASQFNQPRATSVEFPARQLQPMPQQVPMQPQIPPVTSTIQPGPSGQPPAFPSIQPGAFTDIRRPTTTQQPYQDRWVQDYIGSQSPAPSLSTTPPPTGRGGFGAPPSFSGTPNLAAPGGGGFPSMQPGSFSDIGMGTLEPGMFGMNNPRSAISNEPFLYNPNAGPAVTSIGRQEYPNPYDTRIQLL